MPDAVDGLLLLRVEVTPSSGPGSAAVLLDPHALAGRDEFAATIQNLADACPTIGACSNAFRRVVREGSGNGIAPPASVGGDLAEGFGC